MNVNDALDVEGLAANQAGRLSDGQRRDWRAAARGLRKTELMLTVMLVVVGVLVWFAPGPAKDAVWKPLVGIACLLIAAFLLWRAVSGTDAITEDVRAGSVQSVDGAITKRAVTTHGSRGSSFTTHYFDVQNHSYQVNGGWYTEAPDAAFVRLFYLPRSRRVANLLILPAPAQGLPQTPEESKQVAVDMMRSMFTRNEEQRAETRARGMAMATQMKEQMAEAAVAPPSDQRDQRPLAESIIGTWTGPFATVSFDPGGTVNLTMATGLRRSGRWSVNAQGQLVSDVTGSAGATEAWVSGDQLTITMNGMGMTFQRSAGS